MQERGIACRGILIVSLFRLGAPTLTPSDTSDSHCFQPKQLYSLSHEDLAGMFNSPIHFQLFTMHLTNSQGRPLPLVEIARSDSAAGDDIYRRSAGMRSLQLA
jgi:hypothetical protein